MRILMVMQWFDPEPQIKGLSFAKKIRELGHDVEVLTGLPNYPGGKIYPGYSVNFYKTQQMDGIKIIRVPLYPSHSSSVFGRILNYASFGITSFLAGIYASKGRDVLYACGPPVTLGVSVALVSFLRSIPFVYDIQDLWPDSLGPTGMFQNSYGLKLVSKICDWVYARAAHITVQSPGIKEALISRGVEPSKISVIFNWCNESSNKDCLLEMKKGDKLTESYFEDNFFNVAFAGNIGKAQGLTAVLEAAQLLQYENPAVRLLFIGDGVELYALKDIAEKLQLKNVIFLPMVKMNEIGNILRLADVLLVHLKDHPLFKITIPAKTQQYMAVGKPILMAVSGDAANLILTASAGITAIPSSPRSIADALNAMEAMNKGDLFKMGDNGYNFYINKMSLDVGVKNFIDVFKKCCE